jgi:hypothetical protein
LSVALGAELEEQPAATATPTTVTNPTIVILLMIVPPWSFALQRLRSSETTQDADAACAPAQPM